MSKGSQEAIELLRAANAELGDRNLQAFVNTATALLVCGSLVVAVLLVSTGDFGRLRGAVPFGIVGVAAAFLQKSGFSRLASQVMVYGIWVCAVNSLLWTHGLTGTTVGALVLTLAFAGWITGPRSAMLLSIASIPVIYVLAYLEVEGWPISQAIPVAPYHRALVLSITVLGAGGLGYFGALSHRERLIRLMASEGKLRSQVSDLMAHKEALEKSEQRYRTLASSTFEGVAVTERGRIVDANDQLLGMLGYSRDEIVGLAVSDLVLPKDHDRVMAHIRSDSDSLFEHALVRKDGEHIVVEAHGKSEQIGASPQRLTALRDITERKRAEQRLEMAIEVTRLVLWELDLRTQRFNYDPVALQRLGLGPESIFDTMEGWVERIHPDDKSSFQKDLTELLQEERATFDYEYRIADSAGRWHWIHSTGLVAKRGQSGEPLFVVGTTINITARKLVEKAVQESEEQFRRLFDSMREGFLLHEVVYDKEGKPEDLRVLNANPAYYKMIGNKFQPADMIGMGMRKLFPKVSETWLQRATDVALRGEASSFELLSSVTGQWYQLHAYSPRQGQVASLVIDTTERRRAEERINHMAYRDPLTDLPNRVLLKDRTEQCVANAHRDHGTIALLFLDLDHFKNINDSFGHPAGDQLLQETAKRLSESIREADTVGRLGGDEFLIVLPGADADAAAHIAQKLLARTRQPLVLNSRFLTITPSIGIALYPKDGSSFDELLKAADTAMYRAKDCGRNAYRFYAQEMNEAVLQRMLLESDLYQAIEKNEFLLRYQPKFDLRNAALVGMEALVRWNHPELGMILPDQFISVAEESNLIDMIGKKVLQDACCQIRGWIDQGLQPGIMAINFSTRQFAADNLVQMVADTLQEFGLSGDVLEIEITESLLAQDIDHSLQILQSLKRLGLHIAVDDFGTGYSSLSYLKRFPIDRLKIDQSFVRDLEVDPDDRAIARAVVTLGHSLGMRVIAEGVETSAQAEILRDMSCDEIQGYCFGRPMRSDEMTSLLKQHVG